MAQNEPLTFDRAMQLVNSDVPALVAIGEQFLIKNYGTNAAVSPDKRRKRNATGDDDDVSTGPPKPPAFYYALQYANPDLFVTDLGKTGGSKTVIGEMAQKNATTGLDLVKRAVTSDKDAAARLATHRAYALVQEATRRCVSVNGHTPKSTVNELVDAGMKSESAFPMAYMTKRLNTMLASAKRTAQKKAEPSSGSEEEDKDASAEAGDDEAKKPSKKVKRSGR